MSHTSNATGRYRVPAMRRITRGPDTEKLYKAEEQSSAAFRTAANRLEEVLTKAGVLAEPVDKWRDVLPEAIFTFLESQDHSAALVACMAFLDWYRENRPDSYRAACIDWTEQPGRKRNDCPACGKDGILP